MCMYCEENEILKSANFCGSAKAQIIGYYLDIYGDEKKFNIFKRIYRPSFKINYCPICRKEVGRVNEDEIRKRIEILEIRKNGYLEVGNTNQVRKIENEIHKWEDLLERINGSLEKKVEKLENFIKSKDLWESYLHF